MDETPQSEEALLEEAAKRLRELLPSQWQVSIQRQITQTPDSAGQAIRLDQIALQAPHSGAATALLVEVKTSFSPRDVAQLFEGIAKTFRAVNPNNPVLLVAPW